jgi:AraC-like DNA-binding protein
VALATGALVPLAETPLARVWSFAHHRRVAGDPGHEVFPCPTMIFTSAGSWQVASATGRGTASPAAVVLGNRGQEYRCRHDDGFADRNLVLELRQGDRVQAVRDHIERHFADPELSLATLAGVAGWSPSHLIRAFRAATGQSPHRHLLQRRLNEACRLLDLGQQPVTEVCWQAGFGSLSHFVTTFRRETGLPPGVWRGRSGSNFPQARGTPPG